MTATTLHPSAKVLMIDDDENLAVPVSSYLSKFGMEVVYASTPSAGLKLLHEVTPEALILDLMLPEMNGFEVCRQIREFSTIPILMLTARGDVMDRVVGLELGADDYLAKPFEPRELALRLRNIIQRSRLAQHKSHEQWVFDSLVIDIGTRDVWLDNQAVELTGSEYEMLCFLAKNNNKPVTRRELGAAVYEQDEVFGRGIDVMISRIRKKLAPLSCIKTVRNRGYVFSLPKKA